MGKTSVKCKENVTSNKISLQETMTEFYRINGDSYIDGHIHQIILRVIKTLKENSLLTDGEWKRIKEIHD